MIRDEHDQERRFGEGEPRTMLTIDGYELLRATFSRRSQRQIAGWDWMPSALTQIISNLDAADH